MLDEVNCLDCPALKLCASRLYKIVDAHKVIGGHKISLELYCALMNELLKNIKENDDEK